MNLSIPIVCRDCHKEGRVSVPLGARNPVRPCPHCGSTRTVVPPSRTGDPLNPRFQRAWNDYQAERVRQGLEKIQIQVSPRKEVTW